MESGSAIWGFAASSAERDRPKFWAIEKRVLPVATGYVYTLVDGILITWPGKMEFGSVIWGFAASSADRVMP